MEYTKQVLAVRCPVCNSDPGRVCLDRYRQEKPEPHELRVEAARDAGVSDHA